MSLEPVRKSALEKVALTLCNHDGVDGPYVKADVTLTLQIVMPRKCFEEITLDQLENPVFEERLATLIFEKYYNEMYERIFVRVTRKILDAEVTRHKEDANKCFESGEEKSDNEKKRL